MKGGINSLGLVASRRACVNVELPGRITDVSFNLREIGHNKGDQVSWHGNRRSEMVPIKSIHAFPIWWRRRGILWLHVKLPYKCNHRRMQNVTKIENGCWIMNRFKWCSVTCIWVVLINGMLERAVMSRWRPKVTLKIAFIFGSSKQGKARRASVGSIWDTAMYLMSKKQQINNKRRRRFLSHQKVSEHIKLG